MVTILKVILISLGVIVLGHSCANKTVDEHQGEQKMPSKKIEEVLKAHTKKLMSIPGVVGTGIGEVNGKPCIKILVVKKTKELIQKLPSTLEGYPVEIQETGEIRAL